MQRLIRQDKQELVFFENINLRDAGGFKNPSRNLVLVLAIRQIDAIICAI